MAQLSGIRLAIFDVDGTLYHCEELMNLARLINIELIQATMESDATFEQAEILYRKLYKEFKDGIKVLQHRNVREGNEVKITELLDELTKKARRDFIKPDQELSQLLHDLKSNGIGIFVCRNGTLPVTEMILRSLFGLPEAQQTISHREFGTVSGVKPELLRGVGPVDFMIPTTELGVIKPNEIPFRLVLELAEERGIQAPEIVMVGDSLSHDLKVPLEMGMRTVLIGRKEGQKNPGADFMIPNIHHLRQILL